jgi:hypothetical protein
MILNRFFLIAVLSLTRICSFSQQFLPPPDSLSASQQCDNIYLEWQVPDQKASDIISYNVYLGDSLLVSTSDTTYQIQMQGNGFVIFNVTTVYDAGNYYLQVLRSN